MAEIARAARGQGVARFRGTESHLRLGAAVAITVHEGKPRMLVRRSGDQGLLSLDGKLL